MKLIISILKIIFVAAFFMGLGSFLTKTNNEPVIVYKDKDCQITDTQKNQIDKKENSVDQMAHEILKDKPKKEPVRQSPKAEIEKKGVHNNKIYTIQVGSFLEIDKAALLKKELTKKYTVKITKETFSGNPIYVVYIKQISSKIKALEIKTEIDNSFKIDSIILN